MNISNFNAAVEAQVNICLGMLCRKGEEYAPDCEAEKDRLLHFKKAATMEGVSTEQAALGMMMKHIVSISDMCASGKVYELEKWEEKISDAINYLLILKAIVSERGVTHA